MINHSAAGERCHSTQQERSNRRIWGDPIQPKKNEDIRLLFQNINGFGHNKEEEHKTRGFYDLMRNTEADIFTIAETNTDWRRVAKKYTIWDQCKEWFENVNVTASHNQHEKHNTPYQPGGTAIIVQGDMSLQVIEKGYDPHIRRP